MDFSSRRIQGIHFRLESCIHDVGRAIARGWMRQVVFVNEFDRTFSTETKFKVEIRKLLIAWKFYGFANVMRLHRLWLSLINEVVVWIIYIVRCVFFSLSVTLLAICNITVCVLVTPSTETKRINNRSNFVRFPFDNDTVKLRKIASLNIILQLVKRRG